MKVTRYSSEAAERQKYLTLVKSHYEHLSSFPAHFAEIERLTSPHHQTYKHQKRRSVSIEADGVVLAHCTLIRDDREQPEIGWFGFFECPNDGSTFETVWQAVQEESKGMGIKVLRGPINGTIWYPYRFALPGSSSISLFQGELLCEDYYHGFFKNLPNVQEMSYYSAMRENFEDLLRITNPFHEGMLADPSFQLESHVTISTNILKEIFELARRVFKTSWGYVPLSDEELFAYYSEEKLKTLFRAYTLRHNNDLIGFGTVFQENNETLILKTLALDSSFQGKGLGNALIHRIHSDAQGKSARMIYALIRYENNVKRLPTDGASIFREYGTFELPVQ